MAYKYVFIDSEVYPVNTRKEIADAKREVEIMGYSFVVIWEAPSKEYTGENIKRVGLLYANC